MQVANAAAPGRNSNEARSDAMIASASIEYGDDLDDDDREMQDASRNTSKMSISASEELMSSMSLDTTGNTPGVSDVESPEDSPPQSDLDTSSPARDENFRPAALLPAAPGDDTELIRLKRQLEDALQRLSRSHKKLEASK